MKKILKLTQPKVFAAVAAALMRIVVRIITGWTVSLMTPKRPLALTIIAWLFIIAGVFSAWDLVSHIWQGHLSLNLGVLFIFLGRGLLRLRPVARDWALGVVVLGWIVLAVVVVTTGVFGAGEVRFWDVVVTGWRRVLAVFGFSIIWGALLAWMTRVLLRQGVKDLFTRLPAARPTSIP